MKIELVPAAYVAQDLCKKITSASFDIQNEWFFFDGAFNFSANIQTSVNTWSNENFVAVNNGEIAAYLEGLWTRPLDIISGFRAINFNRKCPYLFAVAFKSYLEYLFVNRSCNALNWTVALKNKRAVRQCERFSSNYCGHYVGLRHHAQKSYAGKISDSTLYEITLNEFLEWKQSGYMRRLDLS